MAKLKTTVLVIDESAPLCESLDLLLTSHGYEVHTCRSVREARKLPGLRPAIVLLEVGRRADEAVRFAAEMRKRFTPPVVALMGRDLSEADRAAHMAAAQAHVFVDKPFPAMALMRKLEGLVRPG